MSLSTDQVQYTEGERVFICGLLFGYLNCDQKIITFKMKQQLISIYKKILGLSAKSTGQCPAGLWSTTHGKFG